MSHTPPTWLDHALSYGAAGIAGGGWALHRIVRWWRTRRAEKHMLRVLADEAKARLNPNKPVMDLDAEKAIQVIEFERVRAARQRLWLAQGRKPSAPSRAPADESTEDP